MDFSPERLLVKHTRKSYTFDHVVSKKGKMQTLHNLFAVAYDIRYTILSGTDLSRDLRLLNVTCSSTQVLYFQTEAVDLVDELV